MTEHYMTALARGNEYLPDSQAVQAISASNFKAYVHSTPHNDYMNRIGLSDLSSRLSITTVPFELQDKGLNMRQYGIPGLQQERLRYDLR